MVAVGDSGPIGPLTLPSLIQHLHGEQSTGTLELRDEGIQKTLYFDTGRVVFASSGDSDDRLGQLFLRRRMIRLSTLREAAAKASLDGKRIGAVLVQMKAIRPSDLVWGVSEQVRQMVLSLFQWTRGAYVFKPGKPPSDEVITLNMHTADLILSGVKSIESWSRVEVAVGEPDTRYLASPRLQDLAKQMTLSLDEWTLLSYGESGATLSEICESSSLGDFEVCRLIWGFMVVGLLSQQQEPAVEVVGAV